MAETNEHTRLLREIRLALQQNDYEQAIYSLHAIIDIASEKGDRGAQARHLGNLALTYYRIGNVDASLEAFSQALICAREDDDLFTQSGLLGNMGNILREVRRYDDAIQYLNHALLLAQEIGDQRGRGIWLSNLGLVYDDLQQYERACELHIEAVAVARRLNDQPNIASRLGNLGNTFISMGDYNQALEFFDEAITIFELLGKPEEVALRMGIMGNIYATLARQLGDDPDAHNFFTTALENYQKTLDVARELGDYLSEAELLRSIGYVLVETGRIRMANQYLRTARDRFVQLSRPEEANQISDLLQRIRDGSL